MICNGARDDEIYALQKAGGYLFSGNSDRSQFAITPESCGAKSSGTLCGTCDVGYYQTRRAGCAKCPGSNVTMQLLVVVIAVLGMAVFMSATINATIKSGEHPDENVVRFFVLVVLQG